MRQTQPHRRPSENHIVTYHDALGNPWKIHVTFGLDDNGEHVREVFCSDFKEGTDYHHLAVDACILVSRLLQHGDTINELAATVGRPLSMIGALLVAAAEWKPESELREDG